MMVQNLQNLHRDPNGTPKTKVVASRKLSGLPRRSSAKFFRTRGTEFSGGRLTGPILDSLEIGSLLFVLAMILTFVRPRIAAALVIIASLLCLPLYLFLTAPGVSRRILGGEYSVPLQANFAWGRSAIAGVLTIAVAIYIFIWNLRTVER